MPERFQNVFQTFIQQLKHKLRIPRHHHYTDEETNDDSDKSEEALDEDLLDESYLTRDDFNLHKMIVVVTAPGKVRNQRHPHLYSNFYIIELPELKKQSS